MTNLRLIYILLLSVSLLEVAARGGIRKRDNPKKRDQVDIDNDQERKKRVSRTNSKPEQQQVTEEEEVKKDSLMLPHVSQDHSVGETKLEADMKPAGDVGGAPPKGDFQEDIPHIMPEIYTGHDPVLYHESSYPGDTMMQDEQVQDQAEDAMMSNPEPIPETFPGVSSSNAYVCMKWQDGAWELARETCSDPNLSVCKYESHVSEMGKRIVSTKLLPGQDKDSCYRRCDPSYGLSEAHCDVFAGEECLPQIVGCTKCQRLDVDGCQAWEE